MTKTIYFVRHCRASGQAPDAPLTDEGSLQALELAALLAGCGVTRIVSSPCVRAYQSIAPLAARLGVEIELDARLVERVLFEGDLPDWQAHLSASFTDLDLALPGGESSRVAMDRAMASVNDCISPQRSGSVVIVTHGNLLSLILKHYDSRFGYDDWKALTNPDVYCAHYDSAGTAVHRVWSA